MIHRESRVDQLSNIKSIKEKRKGKNFSSQGFVGSLDQEKFRNSFHYKHTDSFLSFQGTNDSSWITRRSIIQHEINQRKKKRKKYNKASKNSTTSFLLWSWKNNRSSTFDLRTRGWLNGERVPLMDDRNYSTRASAKSDVLADNIHLNSMIT